MASPEERGWGQALFAAVWRGWPQFQALATGDDPEVRSAAVFVLAALLQHAAGAMPADVATQQLARRLADAWWQQLVRAEDELTQANLTFALAALAEQFPEVKDLLHGLLHDSPSELVSYVAALRLVDLTGAVDEAGEALLVEAWRQPGRLLGKLRALLPWDDHDTLARLERVAPGVVERHADVFVEAVRGCFGQFGAGPGQVALRLAFAGRPLPPGASGADLTEAQRRILLACADNGTFWGHTANDDLPLESHGLPATRSQLRAFLTRPGEPRSMPPSDPRVVRALFDRLVAGDLPFEMDEDLDEEETAEPTWADVEEEPEEDEDQASPSRQIRDTVERMKRIRAGYLPDDRKRVRVLELCGYTSDALLAHVAGCPQLRDLDLCWGEATDAGLAHLAGLAELRHLDLSDNLITDAGLVHLKGLVKLVELRLQVEGITDAGLAHLAGLTQLRLLDLAGTQVAGPGLAHLAGLTELRQLWLGGPHLTDAALPQLAPLTALRKLRIAAPQVTGRGLRHLGELHELRQVELDQSGLTDEGLRELPWLPGLRELDLERTAITEAGLAVVAIQPKLRSLNLAGTRVGDGVLEALIRHAGEKRSRKGGKVAETPGPQSGLKDLNLSGTGITDVALAALPAFPRLERLDLSGTRITDAAVEYLLQLRKPDWLGLDNTTISAAGIARLQEAFPDAGIRT
jgi:hypothetical protein